MVRKHLDLKEPDSPEGLIFPSHKVLKMLQKAEISSDLDGNSGVFLTGVLEYMAAELLDMASEVTVARKKRVIKPTHIKIAIKGDEEMSCFMKNVCLRNSGIYGDFFPLVSSQESLESKNFTESSSSSEESDN